MSHPVKRSDSITLVTLICTQKLSVLSSAHVSDCGAWDFYAFELRYCFYFCPHSPHPSIFRIHLERPVARPHGCVSAHVSIVALHSHHFCLLRLIRWIPTSQRGLAPVLRKRVDPCLLSLECDVCTFTQPPLPDLIHWPA